jgi:hypothetical protein
MSCRIQGRGVNANGDERPKRIDAYIDYFASGDTGATRVAADLCGETLLDEDAS